MDAGEASKFLRSRDLQRFASITFGFNIFEKVMNIK